MAIVRDNSSLSQSFAESFRKGLEGVGIQVALEEVIPQGATSAVANLQKVALKRSMPFAVAGILGPEMLSILPCLSAIGHEGTDPRLLQSQHSRLSHHGHDLMDGVVFVDAYDDTKPEAKVFHDI